MEENSGVKFQQAMVALARQWVGQEDDPSQPQTVSIVLPDEPLAAASADVQHAVASVDVDWNELPNSAQTFFRDAGAAAGDVRRGAYQDYDGKGCPR